MTYREQLRNAKNQKYLNNRVKERWQGDPNSIQAALSRTHKEMINDYWDREIERLTELAIAEMIEEKLRSIDFNVTLNGDKITDAVAKEITKDLSRH